MRACTLVHTWAHTQESLTEFKAVGGKWPAAVARRSGGAVRHTELAWGLLQGLVNWVAWWLGCLRLTDLD